MEKLIVLIFGQAAPALTAFTVSYSVYWLFSLIDDRFPLIKETIVLWIISDTNKLTYSSTISMLFNTYYGRDIISIHSFIRYLCVTVVFTLSSLFMFGKFFHLHRDVYGLGGGRSWWEREYEVIAHPRATPLREEAFLRG
jgi:hypothetical protein